MAREKTKCDICGYKAKSARGLSMHITRTHENGASDETPSAEAFIEYVQGLEDEVVDLREKVEAVRTALT